MRDTMYRGKSNDGTWWYGDLVTIKPSKRCFIHPQCNMFQVQNQHISKLVIMHEVIPETVGQFTGVHDKKDEGNELYKDDIVKFRYEGKEYIGTIEIGVGGFIIACRYLLDGYINMSDIFDTDGREYFWIDGEKIGNTHDNKDLLEVQE